MLLVYPFFMILSSYMFTMLRKNFCAKYCPKKKPREVVIVFPYNTETKELYIIQEYIHHYKKSFWKFISGGVDKKNKDYLTHAHEELAEEVGMESDKLYHFYSFEKIFGNRGIHCFIAENPKEMEVPPENPDTDIIEKGEWISEERLYEMLDARELIWHESATVAIQMFRKYRNNHEQS